MSLDVLEDDRDAEADLVRGLTLGFDYLGAAQLVIDAGHMSGDMGLLLFCSVVFGVFGEVAVGNGLFDVFDIGRALD